MEYIASPAYQVFIVVGGYIHPYSKLYKSFKAAKRELAKLRDEDSESEYRLAAASQWTLEDI